MTSIINNIIYKTITILLILFIMSCGGNSKKNDNKNNSSKSQSENAQAQVVKSSYSISGYVKNIYDNDFISYAQVSLNIGGSQETNTRGEYIFTKIPRNQIIQLTASKDGYISDSRKITLTKDSIINFSLTPKNKNLEVLQGIISDDRGIIIINVDIKLKGIKTYQTNSKANGVYHIADIYYGSYSLLVSKPNYKLLSTNIEINSQSKTKNITLYKIPSHLLPQFTSSSRVSAFENQIIALNVKATSKYLITYSIYEKDSDSFNINSSTGKITFKTAPDYEAKSSYGFIVKATDIKGNFATQDIYINIINIKEEPIISNSRFIYVKENQKLALIIKAIDEDGDKLTYSKSGIDASLFNIDSSTGVITFKDAPNYEIKSSYELTLIISKSRYKNTKKVLIYIKNEIEHMFDDAIFNTTKFTDENLPIWGNSRFN